MVLERPHFLELFLDPASSLKRDLDQFRQLLTDGLDLGPGVTFLVGENGTGKSTLVEAIAVAYGMSPEGGSTGARLTTRATESSVLVNLAQRVTSSTRPSE